jgi:CelD/BcsL family acetyltransferase involved in cellulose biosynthesis
MNQPMIKIDGVEITVKLRQPLTEEEMLEILVGIDAETKRLPPGMKAFARAIERAHGIGGGE